MVPAQSPAMTTKGQLLEHDPYLLEVPADEIAPGAHFRFSFEECVTAICMALLFAITLGNVIARYFLNVSFAFTEEYSGFILFFMVFVTLTSSITKGNHIRMSLVTEKASPQARPWLNAAGSLGLLICMGWFTYLSVFMAWDAYLFEETTAGMGYPLWLYLMWLPLLSLWATVRALVIFIRTINVWAA
jgi:TRAP-type C4-dicarboxylate transport system permease small subunit